MKTSTLILVGALILAPAWAAAFAVNSPSVARQVCASDHWAHALTTDKWCAEMAGLDKSYTIPQE